ncbi:exopolyphosphatase [Ferrimonas balearica]|uniref:Ppx/GppA phosphatase family protein n=1 Tax=Ferrimonas balearica TaxID=44012 RepID=UPI001C997E1A|nr:exopolyphosphatase [Ferrimonas balearica]MBY5922590.1 exopolyphosphatase [Ferrimonas balearica]MBY5995574.1 exopolyphosphatase [Ferrimonas balearica]
MAKPHANNSDTLVAAITLGSNSFNMLIARTGSPVPTIIAKHKRKARLARGLALNGHIGDSAMTEGLECLAWFGELLQQYQPAKVAVLATAALRQADNAADFIAQGEPLLGHPIEVISGEREATLIYQGMRAATAVSGTVMVLDIGGASTELVVGDEQGMAFKHSFELGCVTTMQGPLANGISADGFAAVQETVEQALAPFADALTPYHGLPALGVSGTVRSLFELFETRGVPLEAITPIELSEITQELQSLGHNALPGLDAERVPTFAAGVALLTGFMDCLQLPRLELGGGALREGVLVELAKELAEEQN